MQPNKTSASFEENFRHLHQTKKSEVSWYKFTTGYSSFCLDIFQESVFKAKMYVL